VITFKEFLTLKEDAIPLNIAGSGAIAGIGIPPQEEPGISKSLVMKRNRKKKHDRERRNKKD